MQNNWRKPLRLSEWDYRQPAIYHVTICIADRTHRLGTIDGAEVELSPAGEMVGDHILSLPERFSSVGIDSYIIMPNHVHLILEVNLYSHESKWIDLYQPIQAFKSLTTRDYGIGVRSRGWPPYQGILWQKRYFETIMRDEKWLARHRDYLNSNPASWSDDPEAFHRA